MNFRKYRLSRRVPAAIDITPLIDVVFNLLIFLLVSTTFKSQEQAFSIVLPVGDQPSKVAKVLRPTVFVNNDGDYYLYTPGESRTEVVQAGRPLSIEELSGRLSSLAARDGVPTGLSVQADHSVDFQKVLNVVNECKRHGIERVYFPYKRPNQ